MHDAIDCAARKNLVFDGCRLLRQHACANIIVQPERKWIRTRSHPAPAFCFRVPLVSGSQLGHFAIRRLWTSSSAARLRPCVGGSLSSVTDSRRNCQGLRAREESHVWCWALSAWPFFAGLILRIGSLKYLSNGPLRRAAWYRSHHRIKASLLLTASIAEAKALAAQHFAGTGRTTINRATRLDKR